MTSSLSLHSPPAAGFDQPFEMLGACHERVRRMLGLLLRLRAHLQDRGPNEPAQQAARDVLRYFDLAAPQHHEDEERHVLPALRLSGDAALVALAQRLQDDHRAMSTAWALLRPALAALAQGQWPASGAAVAWQQWQDFAALYRGHLQAEDGQAFVAAKRLAPAAAQAAMGAEMAARRGLR